VGGLQQPDYATPNNIFVISIISCEKVFMKIAFVKMRTSLKNATKCKLKHQSMQSENSYSFPFFLGRFE
jgi:hypothetical protein